MLTLSSYEHLTDQQVSDLVCLRVFKWHRQDRNQSGIISEWWVDSNGHLVTPTTAFSLCSWMYCDYHKALRSHLLPFIEKAKDDCIELEHVNNLPWSTPARRVCVETLLALGVQPC